MKLIFKLAYRNLMGSGLRAWLNIIVLSIAYILLIGQQGLMKGVLEQGVNEMTRFEVAGGQFWYKNYDPYDPLSLEDSHGKLPQELLSLVKSGQAAPILICQASIYPQGRVQPILLKGIPRDQRVIDIPSSLLVVKENVLPVLVGRVMAKSNDLKEGDYITIRWRDAKGTYDAIDSKITGIMGTSDLAVDSGQFWVPLEELQKMYSLNEEATIVIVAKDAKEMRNTADWKFKTPYILMKDLYDVVKTKSIGQSILFSLLLMLALLAVFDTQVLSIFRRKKEIGTMMALGMTGGRVIAVFTLEGALNGILAVLLAAIYGMPLLGLFARNGLYIPQTGLAISERIFPSFSVELVLGTVLIVMVVVTIVSYLPTRRISKMNPTDALRGKMS